MDRPKFSLVLFDFDGTIVDSEEGICKSVLYALNKAGIAETDMQRLKYFIGPPLFDSFKELYGVSDEAAQALIEYYREYYAPTGHLLCSVYEGIPSLLKRLRASGCRTAVASAKPEDFVIKICREKGIDDCFDCMAGNTYDNNSPDKIPILQRAMESCRVTEPSKVAMVGDRRFDIEAARALGVYAVGVSFGFGSRQELIAAGANAVADNSSELCDILFE